MDLSSKQSVFDSIKSCTSNEELYAAAGKIVQLYAQAKKTAKQNTKTEKDKVETLAAILDDPKQSRAWWIETVASMAASGNAQATKQLQDALGIVSAQTDLDIQVISFEDVPETCPSCGKSIWRARPAPENPSK